MRLTARFPRSSRWSRKAPFVFVAAMPRSGSTMLAGLLSKPGQSIILSEPSFQRGLHHNLEQFNRIPGVRIAQLARYQGRPGPMLAAFKRKVVPQIAKTYPRIGVKECFLDNWELYTEHFEQIRWVVLVRDPRDMMLSLLEYGHHMDSHRRMWADKSDQSIAERFDAIWSQQKQILATGNAFALRYEDLCTSSSRFRELCKYLNLPFTEPGSASFAIASHTWRRWEVLRHGSQISPRTVFRWRKERHSQHLRRAEHLAELMPDYCREWGYDLDDARSLTAGAPRHLA